MVSGVIGHENGVISDSSSQVSVSGIFFVLVFFFFLTENSRRMAPNGEWASLGVFIVVFSDKMFLSLLPTSSDKFWFCHKRS